MTDEVQEVLESTEPMKVAQEFLNAKGQTKNQKVGIVGWRGSMWAWDGVKWQGRDKQWLEDQCLHWLEDCVYTEYDRKGDFVTRRYAPTPQKMEQVVRCVEAKVRLEDEGTMPMWLPGCPREGFTPGPVIAFKDVLLDAQTGLTMGRDETWFDNAVLPVNWNPEAGCPRWEKCLKEWGGGDERWGLLLQRLMGYCLMSHRRYAKWFLWKGKIRSGKGTIMWMLQSLLGRGACMGASLDDFAGEFGLDGVQMSRVLCVSEVSELDTVDGRKAARVIKNIVGEDPMTINIKKVRQLRNVVCRAVVILQSNEVPSLPNRGRGLSSKLVALPFEVTFEGKEQFDLREELEGELEGIAAWAAKGAMLLEGEVDSRKKWPLPQGSSDVMWQYHLSNNAFDTFLDELFVKDAHGFMPGDVLWEMWVKWAEANKVKEWVHRNQLTNKVAHESSWDVKHDRLANGGKRGLRGLSIKAMKEDA